MNKSYIEWLDYYENATKEDVIQDMMLDIKEIERLNMVLKCLEKYFSKREYYEFSQLVRETKEADIEWLEQGAKEYE